MLQIRKKNGETVVVEDSVAVEFVDSLGRLAVAITQSTGGAVNVLTPGDPVFNAYPQKVRERKPWIRAYHLCERKH